MRKPLQFLLLILGVIALGALIAEIVLSISATTHGDTPARVTSTTAGPYKLKVSLYKDPANAGFALPFAIAPQQPVTGMLNYDVNSVPDEDVSATPVHASISPDSAVPNGIQGAAEITVRGRWFLHVVVNGPSGKGEAWVPVTATAPPPLPPWIGWPIGLIPLIVLLVFLLTRHK